MMNAFFFYGVMLIVAFTTQEPTITVATKEPLVKMNPSDPPASPFTIDEQIKTEPLGSLEPSSSPTLPVTTHQLAEARLSDPPVSPILETESPTPRVSPPASPFTIDEQIKTEPLGSLEPSSSPTLPVTTHQLAEARLSDPPVSPILETESPTPLVSPHASPFTIDEQIKTEPLGSLEPSSSPTLPVTIHQLAEARLSDPPVSPILETESPTPLVSPPASPFTIDEQIKTEPLGSLEPSSSPTLPVTTHQLAEARLSDPPVSPILETESPTPLVSPIVTNQLVDAKPSASPVSLEFEIAHSMPLASPPIKMYQPIKTDKDEDEEETEEEEEEEEDDEDEEKEKEEKHNNGKKCAHGRKMVMLGY
ncbi:unnamed protein product [Camellia sinensis]